MGTSTLTSLKPCYSSSGELAGDYPCDPFAEISTCCGASSVCAENVYCIDGQGHYRVGTCTFEDWGIYHNPGCPCPPVYQRTGPPDYRDGVTFCDDGSFCCGPQNLTCCQNRQGYAVINYGNTATVPSSSEALSSYYENLHVSTIPTLQISQLATDQSNIPTSSYVSQLSSTTRSSAVVQTSSLMAAIPDGPQHQSVSLRTKLGVAIGAAFGFGIILAAAILLYRRYTRLAEENRSMRHELSSSLPNASQYPAHTTIKRDTVQKVYETDSSSRQELHGSSRHELY